MIHKLKFYPVYYYNRLQTNLGSNTGWKKCWNRIIFRVLNIIFSSQIWLYSYLTIHFIDFSKGFTLHWWTIGDILQNHWWEIVQLFIQNTFECQNIFYPCDNLSSNELIQAASIHTRLSVWRKDTPFCVPNWDRIRFINLIISITFSHSSIFFCFYWWLRLKLSSKHTYIKLQYQHILSFRWVNSIWLIRLILLRTCCHPS